MKIAYVANARMPTEKAHGLQIMHMCRAFSQVGHDVTLVVPGRKNWIDKSIWEFYGTEETFKIVYVPIVDFIVWDKQLGNWAFWLTSAWFGLKARRVIEDLDPDVVYSRDPFSSAWSPAWIPHIFEAHTFPNRALGLYRWLWKRCDRIVSVTHGLSRMFREQGVPDDRLRVAADAVDLEQFTVAEPKEACRDLLNLPRDRFLVVYAGHLYPYKGIPDLMKAAPLLHPDIRVVVVGGRPDDLERSKKLVEDVGAKNVIFVGRVPHKDVPRYLAAADLAVMPYTRESHHVEYYSSPLKLFEYLAAGRAILTTDLPSVREILDDTTAEFVPPEDPKVIAAGINRLKDDPARLKELEAHSKRLGRLYTWKNRAEAVLAAMPKPRVEWRPSFWRRYRTEILLALLALAIRLVYVAFFPQASIRGGDGEYYLALADWIRGKAELPSGMPTNFQPGYPYLLAAVRAVFGEALIWGRVVQAFLSAGTVFLMALAARRWIGPYAARIAGTIGALYVPAVLETGIYYTETTYTFLLTLAVFALGLALEKPVTRFAVFSGLMFGLAGAVREIVFYLAAVLPFLFRSTRGPKFLAAFLLPIALTFGGLVARSQFVPAGGPEAVSAPLIAKGYEQQLTNPEFIRSATRPDRLILYPKFALHFFWLPYRLNDLNVNGISAKEVLISGDLTALAAFWDSIGAKAFLTLFHWFVLVMAVFGMAKGGLRRDLKIVFLAVIAYAMATIVLQSVGNSGAVWESQYEPLARYRFPTDPLIIILAASGIAWASRRPGWTDAPSGHDAAFIEAVNLAYHEEEAAEYDGRHPEIFKKELARWETIRADVAAHASRLGRPIRLLDVGAGTGFVARELGPVLGESDHLTMLDLTPAMLAKAEAALRSSGFVVPFTTRVGTLETADFPDASFDVITLNSVLHHLPDPERALAVVDHLLRPGGLLIVGHEPNIRHFRHPIVGRLDRFFRALRALRERMFAAIRRHGANLDPFFDRVNRRLIASGVIMAPMRAEDISSITDIHSPTAGWVVNAGRGFDPKNLAPAIRGYRLRRIETYHHFGKVNVEKFLLLAPFGRLVERAWPEEGALFTVVFEKPVRT